MKAISFLLILTSCASLEPGPEKPEIVLRRQVQQCYEESDSIYMKPPVEGNITYRMTVRADTTVESVKIVKSDFSKDRNFEACVYGILKQTRLEGGEKRMYELVESINFKAKKK